MEGENENACGMCLWKEHFEDIDILEEDFNDKQRKKAVIWS